MKSPRLRQAPSDLLSQRSLIEGYLKKRERGLSAFSFVNIFIWGDFFEFEVKKVSGAVCVFARGPAGCFLYLPPLGNLSAAVIGECFGIMERENGNRAEGLTRIENVPEEDRAAFGPEDFSFYKKAEEYIYRRQDIGALKGGAYKSKRSSYNFFTKNYSCQYRPYEEDMREECLALYDEWAKGREKKNTDEIYRQMIKDSRAAQKRALAFYRELELVGRVVMVEGKIKGYTLGFPLNPQVFCVLFETTDLTVKGLPVYIFREFCNDRQVGPFPFINAMDDFGLDNVAAVKASFHPERLLKVYVATRKSPLS